MGPGRTVGGRYRIVDKIGRGGHGEVYRAQQLPLGRDVALKVLLPEAYAGEGPERFVREASLVQTLDHPNTVRLFDFGVDEGGIPFMAFELLRGSTLEDEIAKAPLSPDRVARIATQVLKALMDAHGRGIVHRDIKPSNVFIVDFAGERDFVKVLDFGVARRAVESTAQPKLTADGEIVGTPAYMAPEQVKDEPIGPSTDLYSLGLVIAEALSGKMVVYGKSQPEIWIKQASSAPVDLPATVLTSAFGPIVLRATNKDPKQRYASAEEMLRAIERTMVVGAGPTEDAPAGPATVPLALPLTPRAPTPTPTPTPPGPPAPAPSGATLPAPMPSRPRLPSSAAPFWTRGPVIAVGTTLLAIIVIIGLSTRIFLRTGTGTGPPPVFIDAKLPDVDAAIPAPPMLPVVENVTARGWKLSRAEDPRPLNGVLVVTAFVFDKSDPDLRHLWIYVHDYANEDNAIAFERTHPTSPGHVVRRRSTRLIIVEEDAKGHADAPAIADQLLP